jgi:SOS-response transcriptional repressor LexA
MQYSMCVDRINTARNMPRMEKWTQRAKARMSEIGITQEQLAERLGVTQGAIGHWLNERREPKLEMINRIMKELGISLLQAVENDSVKNSFDANVDLLLHSENLFKYPVLSWVQAGAWAEALEPAYPGDDGPLEVSDYQAKGKAFWLEVKGDSMTAPAGRSIPEGAKVLVDTGIEPISGKLVVAKLVDSNEATFKMFVEDAGQRFLKPLNPSYPLIKINGNCRIIGVVVRATIPV